MRQIEAIRLLEAIAPSRDERLIELANFKKILESEVKRQGDSESWQAEAAAVLVRILTERILRELPEEVSHETREELIEALASGPESLSSLSEDLELRLKEAQQPKAEFDCLVVRRRCLELRRACLGHLSTIFRSERAQP